MALIAHYKLNGDLKDSVGNNHGVPVTSAAPSFSDGVIGLCGKFDVSPIGSDVGWNINKEFSYSFWAIRDGSDGSSIGGLVGNHYHSSGPTGVNIYFANNNTQIRYAAGDGTDRPSYTVTTPTPTNVWNHYVLSYDGITMRLYQNGEMIHQGNRVIKQDNSRGWAIGRWAASHSNYYLVGRIDDVRIFDHCLSKKEIKALSKKLLSRHPLIFDESDVVENKSILINGEIDESGVMFSGSDSYIDLGDDSRFNTEDNSPISVACWIKPTRFTTRDMVLSKNNGRSSNPYTYMFGLIDGNMSAYNGSAWRNFPSASLIHQDEWTHICWTFDGDTLRSFVNGELIGERGDFSYTHKTSNTIKIGGYSSTSDFNGYIKDHRVYAEALTVSEVEELYQQAASIDNRGSIHTKSITESKSIGFQETPSGGSHNSYGLRFTVSKDTVIKSAKMRPYFTGNATVQLWDFDNQDSPLQEVEIEVTSGKIDLFDLNLLCRTGINYWLTVTGGNFMRTDAGISFPRTHGTFTFTLPSNSGGSTADRWYYFFDVRYAELKSVERFQTTMGKISEKGLVDGLVAWYPLINDTDDYINRNDGVNNGAVAVSDGYEFKTTNDLIVTTDIREIVGNSTSSITFSAWINMTSIDNDINMFMGQFLPYFGFRSSRSIIFSTEIEGIQRSLTSSSQYDLGEWHLATFTFDNGTMRIYVNGVIDRENTNYEGNMTFRSGQLTFGDGNNSSSNWYPFIGKMRDVRVYDRVLNSNEVARLYNTTKPDGSAVSLAPDGVFIKNQIKEV